MCVFQKHYYKQATACPLLRICSHPEHNWSHSFILDHCKDYCDFFKKALRTTKSLADLPQNIREGLKVLKHARANNSLQFPKAPFAFKFCCTFLYWSDLDGMVVEVRRREVEDTGHCKVCKDDHPPLGQDVPEGGMQLALRFGHVDGHETDQPLARERLNIMKTFYNFTTSTTLIVTPGANDRYDRTVAHTLKIPGGVEVIKPAVREGWVVVCTAFCSRWKLLEDEDYAMRVATSIGEEEGLPLGKELAQRCHTRSDSPCGNVHLWPWDDENLRPWDHKEGQKKAKENKARGKRDHAHPCPHCEQTFATQRQFKRHLGSEHVRTHNHTHGRGGVELTGVARGGVQGDIPEDGDPDAEQ